MWKDVMISILFCNDQHITSLEKRKIPAGIEPMAPENRAAIGCPVVIVHSNTTQLHYLRFQQAFVQQISAI